MKKIFTLLAVALSSCIGFSQNEIVIADDGGSRMTLSSNTISVSDGGNLYLNPSRGDVSISENLAIGTFSPLTKLQIIGNTDASLTSHGLLMIGSGTSPNLIFDNNEIMARSNGSASTLYLNRDGGNVEFFKAGTGSFIVHGLTVGDFANMQYNTSNKRFYYDSSTRRLKENITAFHDDWTKILQVKPVTYTRPGDSIRWEYGYIAEEIDSIGLTTMVGYDEDGNPNDLRYDKMIIYLTEMMKIQQDQIGKLEKKITQMETSASFPVPLNHEIKSIRSNKKRKTAHPTVKNLPIAGTENMP